MNYRIIAALLLLTITFQSCFLFKKPIKQTNDDLETMFLDTLDIFGEVDYEEPEQIYQHTATRINDIIHTKLEVSFDWQKQQLFGKATITAKPYFYPVSTIALDARGMEIKEVMLVDHSKTGEGKGNVLTPPQLIPLKFKYENDTIIIILDKEYKKEEQYKLFIDYIAKPSELKKGGSLAITDDRGLYFINPDGKDSTKPQQIWTQGETQASSAWFPTIDRPNERMTQEIYITVDKKYTTLSNGELAFSTDNNDGTRTDCWKMELPHAPYLAMMAIGEFAVVKDKKWRGKEVNYYVEKKYEPFAKNIFGNTPEMLEFFSNKLGVEYPWNKYAQVVVRDYVSGAMENTTATLHGEFLQRTDRELLDQNFEDVISHELFHQWFGDLVTCESWSNLPLNESFATYGEYLWEEYKYGRDAADFHHEQSKTGYISEAAGKPKELIRYQYNDKEEMFDAHSYNKGGQVLHMLRKYVGDDAFYASLKLYLERNKFKAVEIHDLRLAFEETTGEDLNWFFNQWFLSKGHPIIEINSNYDSISKKQIVTINQVQDIESAPLFKMPMYIDLYMANEKRREKIIVTDRIQTFEFAVAEKPLLVNVDAEKSLLCEKNEIKSPEEWVYQYYHAPLYLDRMEALTALIEQKANALEVNKDFEVLYNKLLSDALNDKFWSIRNEAIEMHKETASADNVELKTKLKKLAQEDEKSAIRASAISFLAATFQDETLMPLYKNALNDKSFAVMGAALSAIAIQNPKEGMQIAKQYENEKNLDIVFTIATLYSTAGTDLENAFYKKIAKEFTGFNIIGFVSVYTSYLKNNRANEIVISGAEMLKQIAIDNIDNKWISFYAKKSVKDLKNAYNDKKAELEKTSGGTSNSEIEELSKLTVKLEELYNSIQ